MLIPPSTPECSAPTAPHATQPLIGPRNITDLTHQFLVVKAAMVSTTAAPLVVIVTHKHYAPPLAQSVMRVNLAEMVEGTMAGAIIKHL